MHKGPRVSISSEACGVRRWCRRRAVEIVAEPGFVPIVNFIPTMEGSNVATLRTRLAVEQVDSPSRTKRRTNASKRERERESVRLSLPQMM